jgi:hypothetical protein
MKFHRLEVYVLDFDGLGAEEVQSVLENQRYPNWCISPKVHKMETVDIGEWYDEHPLNRKSTDPSTYFPEGGDHEGV